MKMKNLLVEEKQSPVMSRPETRQEISLDGSTSNLALQRAAAPQPNTTGLPDGLKAGVERMSGLSMDDVRVHYNSSEPAQLNALAYAQGPDIHVGPGQEKHLAHEAWHVAQQKQGRVRPTTEVEGVAVNDDRTLEHEADRMAPKLRAGPVQRKVKDEGVASRGEVTAQRMMRQTLITNYAGAGGGQETLEDNPPGPWLRANIQVRAAGPGAYEAYVPGVATYGRLHLYEDNNGDEWINQIEVTPGARRNGIARLLVQQAIAEHGHIYASNAQHDPGGAGDTRHLEPDGQALVAGLIAQGVMQAGWLRFPVV